MSRLLLSPLTATSAHRGSYHERGAPMGLRKPNLFVIGAMKSGTTYLSKLLGAHPDIFICSPEEPSYFVEPRQLSKVWPEIWDKGYWRSESHYLQLFQPGGGTELLGEASTNYTKLPLITGIPRKIHRFNANAHLIYLMRDPVERTISHYWHMVRFHAERRPMLRAIRADRRYMDVSHYAMQLSPYVELFGLDRISILTFEELTRDPIATMHRLYVSLGVGGALANVSDFGEAQNVTPDVLRMATLSGVFQVLRQSRPFRLMVPYLPLSVRQTAAQLATVPVHRRTIDISDVVNYLRPIQRSQTHTLAHLVGREFPEWATLYAKGLR